MWQITAWSDAQITASLHCISRSVMLLFAPGRCPDDRGYILEHLPECVAWLDLPQYSTSTIRDALKVKGKLNSGRILRITAWKRLRPLTDLVGKELWKAFWECYRCELTLFAWLPILTCAVYRPPTSFQRWSSAQ